MTCITNCNAWKHCVAVWAMALALMLCAAAGGFCIGKGEVLEQMSFYSEKEEELAGQLEKVELALNIFRAVTIAVTCGCCAVAVVEVKRAKKAKKAKKAEQPAKAQMNEKA